MSCRYKQPSSAERIEHRGSAPHPSMPRLERQICNTSARLGIGCRVDAMGADKISVELGDSAESGSLERER
jgi:hypothetical protein